jgi:hypothetical protein
MVELLHLFAENRLSPKIMELLETGVVHVYWVRALPDEMVRAFTA